MPTYEYACRDCGQHVEVVQSFKDDPLTVCGACNGALRKVFSAAGIIFKGSGYYVTDSRKAAKAAEKTSETKTGETKTGETKTGETKTGEKTEKKTETPKTETKSAPAAESA